jgi:hypothetical protein
MDMTVGGVLHNLNDWSFKVNGVDTPYKMPEHEFKAIKPALERCKVKKPNGYGAMMFCPECGNDIIESWRFCPFCGQRTEV